jgi:hypothetical protein
LNKTFILSESVKKSSPWIPPKGRVDGRYFRAHPLQIKALGCKTAEPRIFIAGAGTFCSIASLHDLLTTAPKTLILLGPFCSEIPFFYKMIIQNVIKLGLTKE